MPIKPSSTREIARLLSDLGADDPVRRESAVGRLAVIGSRTVQRLTDIATTSPDPRAATAALRALERIADPRAAGAVLRLLQHGDPDVATAALAVACAHVRSADASAAQALDAIAAAATDAARHDRVRLRAIDALSELPQCEIGPLLAQLAHDPSGAVRAHVARITSGDSRSAADLLERAARGELPDRGDELKQWVREAGPSVPVNVLDGVVRTVRQREEEEPDARRRAEWNAARGAVHQVLGQRGSRIALYDLRETLERAAAPAAVAFAAAAASSGDASCLEPLATAYRRSKGSDADVWRRQIAAAFRAIVTREQLTRRHAALKKIEARWPGLLAELLTQASSSLPTSGASKPSRSRP